MAESLGWGYCQMQTDRHTVTNGKICLNIDGTTCYLAIPRTKQSLTRLTHTTAAMLIGLTILVVPENHDRNLQDIINYYTNPAFKERISNEVANLTERLKAYARRFITEASDFYLDRMYDTVYVLQKDTRKTLYIGNNVLSFSNGDGFIKTTYYECIGMEQALKRVDERSERVMKDVFFRCMLDDYRNRIQNMERGDGEYFTNYCSIQQQ